MSDGFTPDPNPAAIEYQSGPSPVIPAVKPTSAAWRKVVAGLGVVGLVGGGAFAVRSFASPESNTPTQAVQQFVNAINSTDIVSAMEALAPGERNLLIETGVPIVSELTRLDVFAKGTNLRKVDNATLKFTDQTFTETVLREDIATVNMKGGNVAFAADVSKLFGGVINELASETLPQKTAETQKFDSANLATVKRNGRWYVSLSYSIAEAARTDMGKPMPTKAESIAPAGANSPEEAVSQMMNRLAGLDGRSAMALMDPDEMGALQDYAPLFLADLDKATTEGKKQFSLTFPNLGLKTSKNGSSTTVAITKWSADLVIPSTEGKGTRVQLDGDCVTADFEGETSKRCGKELPKLLNDFMGDNESPVDPEVQKAWDQSYGKWVTTPQDRGGISVVERNGKWFVAPVRTMMDSMVTSLKKLKPEDLKGTGKTPEERFSSLLENPLFGSALGASPLSGLTGLSEAEESPAFEETPAFEDLPVLEETQEEANLEVFDSPITLPDEMTQTDAEIQAEIQAQVDQLEADIEARQSLLPDTLPQ